MKRKPNLMKVGDIVKISRFAVRSFHGYYPSVEPCDCDQVRVIELDMEKCLLRAECVICGATAVGSRFLFQRLTKTVPRGRIPDIEGVGK